MNKDKNKLIPELRFPEFLNEGEWLEKKLGKIGEPLMCKRVFKEQTTSNSKDGIPFYKIGTFGRIADSFIPIEVYNEFKRKYSFPEIGEILISASGTIGRLVVYDGSPAYFQDSNIVWLGNDEKFIINSLLYYCYSTIKWQTSDGGVIRRLYNSDLKNIQVVFPKENTEQQKIASCLSSLDEVIAAHSQKLEALKEHKKGLMQNLFPQEGETVPKYRFPEFEKDEDWVEKKLGEIAELTSSNRVHLADYVSKGIPFFRGKEISKLKSKEIPTDVLYISTEQYEEIKEKYGVPKIGDILITAVGTLGNVYCVRDNEKFYFKDGNLIWMKNISINSGFLEVLLDAEKDKVLASAIGSSQKALTMRALNELEFKFPKPKEQQKIASCLSSLDDLITAQLEKIEQLQLHKKGLMQGLFPKLITD